MDTLFIYIMYTRKYRANRLFNNSLECRQTKALLCGRAWYARDDARMRKHAEAEMQ